MTTRIDAHHHIWHYNAVEFDWISDDMAALRRDFLPDELASEMQRGKVNGAIVVQARQTPEETRWLLKIADHAPHIRGVVGWLAIATPQFAGQLEEFREHKRLKGLRHIVQAEPAGFLDGDAFNRGIAAMQSSGLVYDILIKQHQLDEAARFVKRHPHQQFVIDHLAKPDFAQSNNAHWASQMREMAKYPNVACKLSGLVTETDWNTWAPTEFTGHFDVALESFGAQRLMIGTDWPVLTIGCSYAQWWKTVEDWAAPLSETERDAILGGTAMRIYKLD